ncbi:hypothetical protein [Piscinibacterium candidicorallinum]|uniref:Core-binding (CB) domain-containing protein n=1 Tax=Piscinibacterium candidicorallinum TaxID=1793872 RepID=A0ABV7HAD3_9BURK
MARRKNFVAEVPIPVAPAVAGASSEVRDLTIYVPTGTTVIGFSKWLGRGLDAWVEVSYRQLAAMNRSKERSGETLCGYARSGLFTFFRFLEATGACPEPARLSAPVMSSFIAWLKAGNASKKPSSQRITFSQLMAFLQALHKASAVPDPSGLVRGKPFRGCKSESTAPLSRRERQAVVNALKADIIAIHQMPGALSDTQALVAFGLSLSLRTGINTTPMLTLGRSAMSKHPFMPKMGMLSLFKGRSRGEQWVPLVASSSVLERVPVPMDGFALFQKLVEYTAPLAAVAPPEWRDCLWLYRSDAQNRKGNLMRLTEVLFSTAVAAFVRRHGLLGDDGEPLVLNNRRLRVTLENRLWELSNGDLVTVAALMRHAPRTSDEHYLAVTAEMRAHATVVHEDLPNVYRQGAQPTTLSPTPVGACADTLYGERAPKNGSSHCADFLSCLRCRSYAIVGSERDLHRLFSFYGFLEREKQAAKSSEWVSYFTWLQTLIDTFTSEKFDPELVEQAREQARVKPLTFWKNYGGMRREETDGAA